MTEANTRAPRATKNRSEEERRKPWAPPSRLEAPPAPEGFVHRWIRTSIRNEEDTMNVYTRLREGWEPVRAEEFPGYDYPVIDEGKHAGVIGQGGLMLCRIPAETAQERSEYYGIRTREQMTAVDQDMMKEQHPSMPMHSDRSSRVSFGGRKSDTK